MAEVKIAADSGGGSVALSGPSSTTSNAAVNFKLPVADGSANQVLQTDGSGNLSWVTLPTPGITDADQWRITSNGSGANPVTSNWERNDNWFDKIGTGMSESSGIFTFPSTGIWKIDYQAGFSSTSDANYVGAYLRATNDNSTYERLGYAYGNFNRISGTWYSTASGTCIFDVTNVSTHKVALEIGHASGGFMGSTAYHVTGLTFLRLGDT